MENFDFKNRFAENVFTDAEMRKRMPESAYAEYEEIIAKNIPLPLSLANEIAKVATISEKKNPAIDNTAKIAEVKKEIARLNTMFRKGRIEEEEYDKDYAALENDLKKLEAVEQPEARDLTALKKIIESDYRTLYAALDQAHKKAFWRSIIKEFTIGEDRKISPESIIFF